MECCFSPSTPIVQKSLLRTLLSEALSTSRHHWNWRRRTRLSRPTYRFITRSLIMLHLCAWPPETGTPTTMFSTELHLTFSISPIKAALSLYTDSLRSSFKVDATTSNSPLTITNNVSPPDSILHLSAGTSNSPAHVLLAPAYEGTFSVGTSLFSPVVDRSTRKEDPSGRGKERSVNVRNVRGGIVEGAVSWEPSELPRGGAGEVSLRTSNSPVTLIL